MLRDAHAKFPASLCSLETKLTAIPPRLLEQRILLDVRSFLCWGMLTLSFRRHRVLRDEDGLLYTIRYEQL